MRKRGQTWPVGRPVEEGSTPRDRIPPGGCELQPIGTSRAVGQRGSGWDVVRKTHCRSHDGAMGRSRSGKSKARRRPTRDRTDFLSSFSFSFSSSTAPLVGPSGARELPNMTRRLICEAKDWLSQLPHAPVR